MEESEEGDVDGLSGHHHRSREDDNEDEDEDEDRRVGSVSPQGALLDARSNSVE
jgi:hypothetical protein